MEENRVNETLGNILDAIDTVCENIERGECSSDVSASSAVFALARAYDLLAQYDGAGYIEGGEYE